jgi:hypothetical protein
VLYSGGTLLERRNLAPISPMERDSIMINDVNSESMVPQEGAARLMDGLELLKRIGGHAAETKFYGVPHKDSEEAGKLETLLAETVAFVTEGGKEPDETHTSMGGKFQCKNPDGEMRYVEWHFCIDVKDDADLALEAFGEMIGRLVDKGTMDSLIEKMGGTMKRRGGPQSAEVSE